MGCCSAALISHDLVKTIKSLALISATATVGADIQKSKKLNVFEVDIVILIKKLLN